MKHNLKISSLNNLFLNRATNFLSISLSPNRNPNKELLHSSLDFNPPFLHRSVLFSSVYSFVYLCIYFV